MEVNLLKALEELVITYKAIPPEEPPEKPIREILTTRDISERYKISNTQATNMMHAESCPSFKIGEQWRVYADEFEEWEREFRQKHKCLPLHINKKGRGA